jgi:hypothetical protein
MKRIAKYSLIAVAFSTLSAVGFAQVAEIGLHAGASRISNSEIGVLSSGGTDFPVTLDDGWRLGFRLTINNWRFFGNEFGYAYNRTQLKIGGEGDGMAIHQGFYNFLGYALPEGSVIRPFATVGVHFSNYTPPGSSAASGGGDNKFGFNYGGGLKVRISPLFLLRFDVRQYQNGKPFDLPSADGLLRQTEISAGFSLAL